MNSTILAERQAKAIQAIREHAARLGGEYVQPTARVDSPATKYVLILEAVVSALAGIDVYGGREGNEVEESPSTPVEVEAVEAIISVVKEPPAAPKAKRRGQA